MRPENLPTVKVESICNGRYGYEEGVAVYNAIRKYVPPCGTLDWEGVSAMPSNFMVGLFGSMIDYNSIVMLGNTRHINHAKWQAEYIRETISSLIEIKNDIPNELQ